MLVKPAAGRAVRDPITYMLLPDDGREVPDDDAFWNRRVLDGDVTVEEAAPPGREAAAEPERRDDDERKGE